MRNSFHHVHFGPRHTADWTVPAVSNAHVEVSGVEIFKVLVQRDKVLKHIESKLKGKNVSQQIRNKRNKLFSETTSAICKMKGQENTGER